jgi:hypothetical protein
MYKVGDSPRVLIRLPSVLTFFFFGSKAKLTTRSLTSQFEIQEKVTNVRAFEYDVYIVIPFPVATIGKIQKK